MTMLLLPPPPEHTVEQLAQYLALARERRLGNVPDGTWAIVYHEDDMADAQALWAAGYRMVAAEGRKRL